MSPDEIARWYVIAVATLNIAAGSAQMAAWRRFSVTERLVWQAAALLNLSGLIGAAESLAAHLPAGVRTYLLAVGVTFLAHAVLYRPWSRWRARHRQEP